MARPRNLHDVVVLYVQYVVYMLKPISVFGKTPLESSGPHTMYGVSERC